MQLHEVALVAVLAGAAGYGLNAFRERIAKRRSVLMVATDASGHTKALTVGDYERRAAALVSGLRETVISSRDSVLAAVGGLRRDTDDMAELLGKVEVLLRDAVGRAVGDRELTRQRQEISEASKQELRSELMGMRKALDRMASTLQTSTGQFVGAIQHFEKRVEDIFK